MAKHNQVFKEAYNRCLVLLASDAELPTEPALAAQLGVSRTTVRAVLAELVEAGLIAWDKRTKVRLRPVVATDRFAASEVERLGDAIEQAVLARLAAPGTVPGSPLSELDLARQVGAGTTAVREYLIRFSRTGLIEKRANSHWVVCGLTESYLMELFAVREPLEISATLDFLDLPADHPAWQELADMDAQYQETESTEQERRLALAAIGRRMRQRIIAGEGNRFMADIQETVALVWRLARLMAGQEADNRCAPGAETGFGYLAALISGEPASIADACRSELEEERRILTALVTAADPVSDEKPGRR